MSLVVILLIVLGLVGWQVYNQINLDKHPILGAQKLEQYAQKDEQTKSLYSDAIKLENDLWADPANVEKHLSTMMKWKSLGDVTGTKEFYERSNFVLMHLLDQPNGNTSLVYQNIATNYKYVGDYKMSEQYYRKAIELAPGDPDIYLLLVELYKFRMNKPKADIMAVYEEALAKIAQNNVDVVIDYAAYLYGQKEYQKSYEYYKLLVEKFPTNKGYKDRKDELDSILKNQSS